MDSYTKTPNKTLLDLQRERLEALLLNHPTNTAYRPGRLGQLLSQLGQRLVHWLADGSTPKISKRTNGDTEVWKVYDPVADRTLYFDQEDAVRIWIDERHYQ